jgi:hypothetical protein
MSRNDGDAAVRPAPQRVSTAAVAMLWLAFSFVTWNVVFDRQVATAALDYTQEQVGRYDRGEPTARIDEGFAPRVRRAALIASIPATLILVAGALVMRRAWRRAA